MPPRAEHGARLFAVSEAEVLSPVAAVRARARERPDALAFRFLERGEIERERLTWAALDARGRALAAALRTRVAPGDRVLLLHPPGLDYAVAFLGCLMAGAIAVPAYPPLLLQRATALEGVALDAKPQLVLTTAALLESVRRQLAGCAALRDAVWLAGDVVSAEAEAGELPLPRAEDAALLQYTSGSTSRPRGVVVTHANLTHNALRIGRLLGLDEHSIAVMWVPPYHDMGLIGGIVTPLVVGCISNLISPVDYLRDPLCWLRAISREGATVSGAPDFAYRLCVRRSSPGERRSLDLSRWQVALSGAEPVRGSTLDEFARAFADAGLRREALMPAYGLAESTLVVTAGAYGQAPRVETFDADALARGRVVPAGGSAARTLVSCGPAEADSVVAIVNPRTRRRLGEGQVGEIWLAGPSVARGYWRNAALSVRTFAARLSDGDGPYLRTGDLGFLRDGELFVTGRRRDLLVVRGRNHYPQDVEATVEEADPRLRAGCIAAFLRDSDDEAELIVVAEVRQAGLDHGAQHELARCVRGAVRRDHGLHVATLLLVEPRSIPKTSSGKIQRRRCREAFETKTLALVAVHRTSARSA